MMVYAGEDVGIGRLRAVDRRLAVETRASARTGRSHEDADDVVGTAGTDDAVGFDPLPLLRALHERGARVAAIGQVAGIMHGSMELTGDLDLLWTVLGRGRRRWLRPSLRCRPGWLMPTADGWHVHRRRSGCRRFCFARRVRAEIAARLPCRGVAFGSRTTSLAAGWLPPGTGSRSAIS